MPPRASSDTFVGRLHELGELDGALSRARDGAAAVALIGGESGIGKTRLVDELVSRARAAGDRVLVGECVNLGAGELPYAPIVGALRRLPHDLDDAELETVLGGARDDLSLLVPELAGDRAAAAPPDQPLLFEQLLGVLGRLGRLAPHVLVVEDLHWVDRATREFLAFLVRNVREQRLLVVGTYRSEELHRRHPLRPFLAEAERSPHVVRLALEPFTRDELAEQLSGILGERADAALADELFARAEGNPFFTEELLAATQGDRSAHLPDSIRDALLLRIESLGETTQQVLRVAAAAGPRVGHGLLAAACPVADDELNAGVREALAHNVLVRDDTGDGYAFRHTLLREALYDDLLPGERGPLHRTLAGALSDDPSLGGAAAELAHHWFAAHDLPAALAASLQAGEDAERMSAFAAANAHFERALEVWDSVPEDTRPSGVLLADVLRRAADAANQTGDHERAAALARRALAQVDADADPTTAALLEERIGLYLFRAGHPDDALASYRSGAARLPADKPTPERAVLLGSEGHALMLSGRFDEASERCEEALEIVQQVGPAEIEASILATLGPSKALSGDTELGLDHLRRAGELARAAGDHDLLLRAHINRGELLDQTGRTAEGADLAVQAAGEVRGARYAFTVLAGDGATRLLKLGRWQEAEALIDPSRVPLAGLAAATLLDSRAFIAMMRGDFARAASLLDEGARAVGRASRTVWQAWQVPIAARRAEVALWQGDANAAITSVARPIADAGDTCDLFYVAPLFAAAARAHADVAVAARALHDEERESAAVAAAADMLRRLRSRLDTTFVPPESEHYARMCELEAARAADEDDADGWADVAGRWEAFVRPYLVAYSRWREAESALSRGGDRSRAQAALGRAAWALGDIPAEPLVAEIEGLAQRARLRLTEAGEGAPEPAEASTAERLGLTPRELDVLRLVAAGQTNKEIAAELFISDKTASVHVSRILAKLNVRGRVDAASVAHRLGLAEPVGD